jgi:hypothetical protein
MVNKKSRIRRNQLPRKSKLRGKLKRLELRRENKPHDQLGMHYIMPGSMKK